MRRGRTNTAALVRPVCKHGTECYRRNPVHLEEEAHPADEDYLESCAAANVTPEFVSVRKLFEWCDSAGTGKASKESAARIWGVLQRLGTDIGSLEDEWEKLDDDGNGFLNFSEFAEFTTSHSVSLPLGLDDLLRVQGSEAVALRCGVVGCGCRSFATRRPRCRYGAECYQTNEEHRRDFLHPGDEGWEASGTLRDKQMCRCGHKMKLHASSLVGARSVAYPSYWASEAASDQEFNVRVPTEPDHLGFFQQLVDATYSDVTTRDRLNHCKTWMVPSSFHVTSVRRNENSRLWRKYTIKRGDLQRELSLVEGEDSGSCHSHALRRASATSGSEGLSVAPEFGDYGDALTTGAWEALTGDLGLAPEYLPDRRINEWLLFHGTSAAAAENICGQDFTMRLAGSATGTLYGRGTYLAESFTKADEYAKDEGGVFTVLLCRVLGGRVRYCDERNPDADALVADCTEGMYDCILGDRKKCSGTYREIVVFDTENVYPEYVLRYTRGEFFKSPSHP